MFSSTFFHWQNRVNLSLQGRAERARVEIPEQHHPLKDSLDLSGHREHPLGHLGNEETPECPVWGPLVPLWAGRPWSPVLWDPPIRMGISSQLTSQ